MHELSYRQFISSQFTLGAVVHDVYLYYVYYTCLLSIICTALYYTSFAETELRGKLQYTCTNTGGDTITVLVLIKKYVLYLFCNHLVVLTRKAIQLPILQWQKIFI